MVYSRLTPIQKLSQCRCVRASVHCFWVCVAGTHYLSLYTYLTLNRKVFQCAFVQAPFRYLWVCEADSRHTHTLFVDTSPWQLFQCAFVQAPSCYLWVCEACSGYAQVVQHMGPSAHILYRWDTLHTGTLVAAMFFFSSKTANFFNKIANHHQTCHWLPELQTYNACMKVRLHFLVCVRVCASMYTCMCVHVCLRTCMRVIYIHLCLSVCFYVHLRIPTSRNRHMEKKDII